MKNNSPNVFEGLILIIVIPILIVLAIIIVPPLLIIFLINTTLKKLSDKIKLKKLLKLNNGKIYFIYAEYNTYDFSTVFKEKHKDVICIKVNRRFENDLLVNYLVKDRISKCYPSLVKIENDNLIIKEHYNSFKNLYKRGNDINAFLNLINKSINNLRK